MQQLDQPRRVLAIALATLAGFVDAIGFLAAGGYFASFMSGNTTRLGVDIAEDPAIAFVPAALIAGFVTGVTTGALLAERAGSRRKTAVLAVVSALLLAAAACGPGRPGGLLAASVIAMGVLNNVFRRDGEVAIGITYMTGALVRFGQGLAAFIDGRPARESMTAGMLWLGLASGAILGALAFGNWHAAALWIAASAGCVLTVWAWRIERANGQIGS